MSVCVIVCDWGKEKLSFSFFILHPSFSRISLRIKCRTIEANKWIRELWIVLFNVLLLSFSFNGSLVVFPNWPILNYSDSIQFSDGRVCVCVFVCLAYIWAGRVEEHPEENYMKSFLPSSRVVEASCWWAYSARLGLNSVNQCRSKIDSETLSLSQSQPPLWNINVQWLCLLILSGEAAMSDWFLHAISARMGRVKWAFGISGWNDLL